MSRIKLPLPKALRLAEIARVLVRLDHVARFLVNANHGIASAAAMLRVANCVAVVA
jgi:hypothetical protein